MMVKKKLVWVLIADGARARILVALGRGHGLAPVAERDWAAARAPTRSLGGDKPGRAFESSGDGTRHAMEPKVDWQRFEKTRFAREIAALMDEAAAADRFDGLVVVAPPATLGDLRKLISERVRSRIMAEIDKDLTTVADHDLPRHLADRVPC